MLENASQNIACDYAVLQQLWNIISWIYSIASCGRAYGGRVIPRSANHCLVKCYLICFSQPGYFSSFSNCIEFTPAVYMQRTHLTE